MAFEVVFRERLPQDVLDELDQHNATLSGYLDEEHNEDGSHADITADSVTVRPGGTVELAEGAALRVIDGVPTLVSEGPELALATRADPAQPITNVAEASWEGFGSGGRGKKVALTDALLSVQRLCLFPQASYEAQFADATAFADSVGGPRYSVYRVTGGNIEGIYSPIDFADGSTVFARGQVIVLINDKDTPLNLAHLGAVGPTSPRKIIGGPLYIDPAGAALLVYDEKNAGWQIVGSHGTVGKYQSYTPTWISSGTQPSVGTGGSITGRYALIGNMMHVRARVTLGTGFSFGTGTHGVTFPNVIGSTLTPPRQTLTARYVGTDTHVQVSYVLAISGTAVMPFITGTGPIASVTSSSPFTFAAGDTLEIGGTVELA